MKKKIEVCSSPEWVRVFSGVCFQDIPEEDHETAAEEYLTHVWNYLEESGFEPIGARGQRVSCHGWNGANTFNWMCGPVGTHAELTKDEKDFISSLLENAENLMREVFAGQWPLEVEEKHVPGL